MSEQQENQMQEPAIYEIVGISGFHEVKQSINLIKEAFFHYANKKVIDCVSGSIFYNDIMNVYQKTEHAMSEEDLKDFLRMVSIGLDDFMADFLMVKQTFESFEKAKGIDDEVTDKVSILDVYSHITHKKFSMGKFNVALISFLDEGDRIIQTASNFNTKVMRYFISIPTNTSSHEAVVFLTTYIENFYSNKFSKIQLGKSITIADKDMTEKQMKEMIHTEQLLRTMATRDNILPLDIMMFIDPRHMSFNHLIPFLDEISYDDRLYEIALGMVKANQFKSRQKPDITTEERQNLALEVITKLNNAYVELRNGDEPKEENSEMRSLIEEKKAFLENIIPEEFDIKKVLGKDIEEKQ